MRRKMKVGKSYTLTEKDLDEMAKDYDEMIEELLNEGKHSVTATFNDWPGLVADKKCHAIFKKHSGEFLNCGTWLGDVPERDVQYAIPTAKLKACKAALKAAGVRF
jgi:hypothetical protein